MNEQNVMSSMKSSQITIKDGTLKSNISKKLIKSFLNKAKDNEGNLTEWIGIIKKSPKKSK